MKIKTSELTGAALDWAVAKCENDIVILNYKGAEQVEKFKRLHMCYAYSTNWAFGGPIVEREIAELARCRSGDGPVYFEARCGMEGAPGHAITHGPTPLIAAMRCYVASKLGDEIDVPEELTQGEKI
jgi:hypothetical protein